MTSPRLSVAHSEEFFHKERFTLTTAAGFAVALTYSRFDSLRGGLDGRWEPFTLMSECCHGPLVVTGDVEATVLACDECGQLGLWADLHYGEAFWRGTVLEAQEWLYSLLYRFHPPVESVLYAAEVQQAMLDLQRVWSEEQGTPLAQRIELAIAAGERVL